MFSLVDSMVLLYSDWINTKALGASPWGGDVRLMMALEVKGSHKLGPRN